MSEHIHKIKIVAISRIDGKLASAAQDKLIANVLPVCSKISAAQERVADRGTGISHVYVPGSACIDNGGIAACCF